MPDRDRRFRDLLRARPGEKVDLSKVDASDSFGWKKDDATAKVEADLERLAAVQEVIWAEHRHRVLIVLQGIDASGKDGTIRHVMRAFNPQGCRVVGFDVPTLPERAHDFLWRIHAAVPGDGEIAIFNRSHYEAVLVERVHELVPKEVWSRRYGLIDRFETLLLDEGTTILKFFLHIDKDEQLERLKARLDDPTKRWKFNIADLDERKRWDDYAAAFEEMLARCSTERAPWYVIPANRKWFRDLAIGEIVADALEALHPQYPVRDDIPKDLVLS